MRKRSIKVTPEEEYLVYTSRLIRLSQERLALLEDEDEDRLPMNELELILAQTAVDGFVVSRREE